jgi:hypothetical protein
MRLLTYLIALLANITAVSATSVVQFSFDSLCETSAKIAHVQCVTSKAIVAEDGIRTETRFKVFEGIKGEVGKEIVIALPGGQIGDRRVTVPGMPSFREGEETVLFLSGPDGTGSPWPVGLGQGCYRVLSDESGERAVHLQMGATPIPEGTLFKPASSLPYRIDLQTFIDKVRETSVSPANTQE